MTIDLGEKYNIDQIDLYNTHNRQHNNFSTDSFRIDASNSVTLVNDDDDFDLSGNITTILSGNLSDTAGEDPITTVDSFSFAPTAGFRYLKFVSITGFGSDPYTEDRRGLNEIQVFGTTGTPPPPPTSFTWNLAGLGDWTDASNWDPDFNAPPNNPNYEAIFEDRPSITGPTLVSVMQPVTVNRIEFTNTVNSLVVAGLGSVNMSATTAPTPDDPTMSAQGTHEFQVAVNLLNDANIDVASDSTLTFNNSLNLMSHTLTKAGDGSMIVNNVLSLGGGTIDVQQGTVGGNGTIGGDVTNDGTISPGNSVQGNTSVVPEPSSLLLLAAGWLLMTFRRKS